MKKLIAMCALVTPMIAASAFAQTTATPATPATPAKPAATAPATPAMPATPATPATPDKPAANAQQDKMKACNADPKAKATKGDERKAFMKECLSK